MKLATIRTGTGTAAVRVDDDLVFGPADLVACISQIITRVPGDLIATGTPAASGTRAGPRATWSRAMNWSPASRMWASCATPA